MKALLKCELLKLEKSICYKILILGVVLYAVADIYFAGSGIYGTGNGFSALFDSFQTWGRCLMVSGIFAGLFIGGDFNNRILYSEISVGNSRSKVFFSKAFIYWLSCIILTLLYQAVYISGLSLRFGFGYRLDIENIFFLFKMELAYLGIFSAFLSICLLAAFFFKSMFEVTAVEIIWIMFGTQILSTLARTNPVISSFYGKSIFHMINDLTSPFYEVVNYDSGLSSLQLLPPEAIIRSLPLQQYTNVWLVAVPTIALTVLLACRIFKKAELK